MNIKKTYSALFTIIFFVLITSAIVPVGAVQEDFSDSPSPKATAKTTASPKVAAASTSASPSATPKSSISPSPSSKANQDTPTEKMSVLKGEVSATPSAIGKFLINVDGSDKNVDTDKKTKVYSFDSGKKTAITVSKLKIKDKVVVIGQTTADTKSFLARYILVMNNPVASLKRNSMYGIVATREASGAAFIIDVKSPNKDDEKKFTLNSSTVVIVKDIENPKLSDIKIGDRVTLTYYKDGTTNFATRILSNPGRAAGLLKDIRDASTSASPKASTSALPTATAKSSASPTAKVSATPTTQ
jgi:hypothetical protein